MTFGRNQLIELIMAFGRNELIEPNDVGPKLIFTSMFGRSNQSLLNGDFQLVVKLIPILLTSEGARAPSSNLIVECIPKYPFNSAKIAEYFMRE